MINVCQFSKLGNCVKVNLNKKYLEKKNNY